MLHPVKSLEILAQPSLFMGYYKAMVTVIFPSQFSKILNGKLIHLADGSNLSVVLENICKSNTQLREHLFSKSGGISPFIAFSVAGNQNIYTYSTANTFVLKPTDIVEIILPMAGG